MNLSVLDVVCPRCGSYRISELAIESLSDDVRGRVSGFCRRAVLDGAPRPFIWQGKPSLTSETLEVEFFRNSIGLDELLAVTPSRVVEKQDALLLALSSLTHPGKRHELTEFDASLAYTTSEDELHFYRNQLEVAGFLVPNAGASAIVTTSGWMHAEDLRRGGVKSRRAFVAMWFTDEMNQVYKAAIQPAIEGAGYEPRQLSFIEHNDDINDRILAEIRGARFVVADFTGNRPGVYLEAGFALGLGRMVIWTVREDCASKLHFDTRNRNHIVWANPGDLKERLHYRILATVPAM